MMMMEIMSEKNYNPDFPRQPWKTLPLCVFWEEERGTVIWDILFPCEDFGRIPST